MVGLVVTVENEMYQVNYDAPHYDVIREAVCGRYERVCPVGLERHFCWMVNEDGLLKGLPVNLVGSVLYGTFQHGHPIVGNAIFLKNGYYGGEHDVVGMTADEAQHLGDKFSAMTGGIVRWTTKKEV